MHYSYTDSLTGAHLALMVNELQLHQACFDSETTPTLTIAWNRGADQRLFLDGEAVAFPANSVAPLAMNQAFRAERAHDLVVWQFDKPFYCIERHDAEVSCIGFLFWGNRPFRPIAVAEKDGLEMLLTFFVAEFHTPDRVQNEMLLALLKRLLVKLTGMMREQVLTSHFRDTDLDMVRQFNVLLEKHFRRLHQVQDYAALLHRSPKTLTNVFALYTEKSPLQTIHDRILLEARRLLLYTDKPVGEIAAHLGYDDVAHFSRLFKNRIGIAPADWRKTPDTLSGDIGK